MEAAVLIPLFEDVEGEARLVLTKRPDTMPTHAGHLSFPGGRRQDGDRGAVDTALREAEEEVGIDRSSVEVLGHLPPVDTVQFTRLVIPVIGRVAPAPRLRPSPREVVKVLTPSLRSLADDTVWRSEAWGDRRVWFHDIDGEVLWGATAFMTRRLLGMAL